MTHTLRLQNISHIINGNPIFNELNFEFANNIYHLIGNNGSGKTTLFKLIMGLNSPTGGKIFLDGEPLSLNNISSVHYAPDELPIYEFLTGNEFINWIAQMRPSSNLDELIMGFNVQSFLNKPFSEMSLGTKKKFVLISTFMGNPKFILLDEPFNALDVSSQEYLMHKILSHHKKTGIIFTNHNVQEVKFSSDFCTVKIVDQILNLEYIEQNVTV